MKTFDIVIVGGGLVGAFALLGLKRLSNKLKIALIDSGGPLNLPENLNKTGNDYNRSIVLSHASRCILSQWGCWQSLSADSSPVTAVHISQAGRLGRTKIEAKQYDLPALGYVIPENKLNAFLNKHLTECEYFHNTSCKQLFLQEDDVALKVQTPEKLETWKASLILAADGADSKLRSLVGIPTKERLYNQHALVTQVRARHHTSIGYERFIGQEVLACVPRNESYYGVIWKADPEKCQELMNHSREEFLRILMKALAYRLGECSELGDRKIYPLKFVRALKETLPGFVLLGDAAHANPPMAAQGLNLSLRDIACLIDKIEEAVNNQQEFRSEGFLKAYEDERLADQSKIINFVNFPMTHTFHLIPNTLKGLTWFGMDVCGGVKGMFARTMMGF